MITRDLREAIARAVADENLDNAPDPGLRPGKASGQYSSSVVLARGAGFAGRIAVRLENTESWIESARVTGTGYVTVTVTPEALYGVAERVAEAGGDCVRSDALAGRTYQNPAPRAWEHAATWDEARKLLAAELTARLAGAAGARAESTDSSERAPGPPGAKQSEPGSAVAFAGRDAVLFSLARAMPSGSISIDERKIARHHPGNPAYAVRYAHARAASGVRWAAAAAKPAQASPQRPSADPGEPALLDALSWLPERVATAARRGRPDEFARYLERLADVTLAALTRPPGGKAPGSDRLALARAARTGLAAGLELLGVNAPERLLPNRPENQLS